MLQPTAVTSSNLKNFKTDKCEHDTFFCYHQYFRHKEFDIDYFPVDLLQADANHIRRNIQPERNSFVFLSLNSLISNST